MKVGQIVARLAFIAVTIVIIGVGVWLTLPAGVMGR